MRYCRRAGTFATTFGPIDHVESHIENWLWIEAKIRGSFGLRGIGLDKVFDVKRKSLMAKHFEAAGVGYPSSKTVTSETDCYEFMEKRRANEFVIKPDIGVVMAHTSVIRSFDDISTFFARSPSDISYIIQERAADP
jgi:hypothetical protein